MKILYHTWNEWMKRDVTETLESMGHKVTVNELSPTSYDDDPAFTDHLNKILDQGSFDFVFSMNYFPIISNICEKKGIRYVSWISDCPCLPLYSNTVSNNCNTIFCFDRVQCNELLSRGANAYNLPLAVNTKRLDPEKNFEGYKYDVSFLGSFYRNAYNQIENIKNMPPALKGYIDGVSNVQSLFFGADVINEFFDAAHLKQLSDVALVNLGDGYADKSKEVYLDWIRKNVTVLEREKIIGDILKTFGSHGSIAIASDKLPEGFETLPGLLSLGYVDYCEDMPKVFRNSKINLNLTLRSITSGIPLRVTDVLGAGGFIITNFQPEMELYFENGKNIVWFSEKEELFELIAYYLKNDEERERIRVEGRKTAEEVFSYERLMGIILENI